MITFNGYDLSQDIKVTDVKRPVLPPSVLTSSNIVGRSGAFLFYKQFGAQTIPVDFLLVGTSLSNLRSKVRTLAEKLDTDVPAPLIFSDEPDKYIKAIVSDSTELNETLATGKGTINFFCPDPYWYATEDDIIQGTSARLYEFTRKGTAESYPLIEIEGTNTSGSITITNEMTTMSFTGTLATGEVLYLDTDLLTAYVSNPQGATRSVINKLSNLDFPVLKKGSNALTVSISGGATVTKVKITCRSRWK